MFWSRGSQAGEAEKEGPVGDFNQDKVVTAFKDFMLKDKNMNSLLGT